MLVSLYIENVAVIERSEIAFEKGFNVLTGETGAGKSIIIDSINAILGERTNRELIRTGATSAKVTALFAEPSAKVCKKMEELGVSEEEDHSLLIQREFSVEGKSVFRMNGRPVTASIMREIGRQLINIHGQHENQALLSPQAHIHYVDSMGELEEELEAYQAVFHQAVTLKKQLLALHTDTEEKERQIDLLKYQIRELEEANIREGEQDELSAQKNRYLNAERIITALGSAKDALNGQEDFQGAVQLLSQASVSLAEAAKFAPELSKAAGRLQDLAYEAEDLSAELRDSDFGQEFDPAGLETIEARLDELYRLGLKYGSSEKEMLEFLSNAQTKLDDIEVSDERRTQLEADYRSYALQTKELAEKLSEKRQKVAKKFTEAVKQELVFLDMPHVDLVVEQERGKLTVLGCDNIQFLISTNPGEPPKPIAKIASGGELSRIMLAIKNVLADKDDIDTLIFDEVDTGISGRAAQKVGQKLHEVAQNRQILCVTHLAQIAAHGDHHLLIEKHVRNGKTFTDVRPLDFEGRKNELARIMSGADPTELQLKSAEELLQMAKISS